MLGHFGIKARLEWLSTTAAYIEITKIKSVGTAQGGTRTCFWRGVRREVWNPFPYLRIFLPQQNGWFYCFFCFCFVLFCFVFFCDFCKLVPISMGYSTLEMTILWFLLYFCKKWDPCLRISCEKLTHFCGTSPYTLTWVRERVVGIGMHLFRT